MEYTRSTLIKRLEEYVGILPSELHEIAYEAVELLERFECSKGSRLINLDDAIEIISNQQDGSGITYEILSLLLEEEMIVLPQDYVKVVWCKDCRHYLIDEFTATTGWCYEIKNSVNEDDYCSYGERRKP